MESVDKGIYFYLFKKKTKIAQFISQNEKLQKNPQKHI